MRTPSLPNTSRTPPSAFATWSVALSLAGTLFFFVPAHAYLVNQATVLVFFDEMLAFTATSALVLAAGTAGLLLCFPERLRIRLVGLLFAAAILCWIHAYCLVWSYEAMDGEPIRWGRYAWRSWIDSTLWVGICGTLFWFAPRWQSRIPLLCWALLVIQGGSLTVNAVRVLNSSRDLSKHYYVDKQPVFQFSPERNVILILLDEFQTDIFSEVVLPNEEFRRNFDGFTYFPDTTAGFNFTEFAIPAILTGRIYANRRPRGDFLRAVYLKNSLPVALREAGVDVHLYPWRSLANESIYYHDDLANNVLRRPRPLADKLVDVARIVDLGLFRSLPQPLKPYIHNNSAWLISRALAQATSSHPPSGASGVSEVKQLPREIGLGNTLDDIFRMFALGLDHPDAQVSVRPGPPVFKFYHLAGLHVPVKMRRDLTYGNFEYNRRNFSEQAEAYARIIGAFLGKLRQVGVFDNSLIIIVGDHGSGRARDMYVNPGQSARTAEMDLTASRGDFQRDKARGLPLLLVKRVGAVGPLAVSPAAASLVDVQATVRAELGIPQNTNPAITGIPEFYGLPLFPREAPAGIRTRYYGAMLWTPQQSDFLGTLSLYRIQGHGWDDESWAFIQRLNPPR